jgi:hypothetical protein
LPAADSNPNARTAHPTALQLPALRELAHHADPAEVSRRAPSYTKAIPNPMPQIGAAMAGFGPRLPTKDVRYHCEYRGHSRRVVDIGNLS